jgi:hypothetical protein
VTEESLIISLGILALLVVSLAHACVTVAASAAISPFTEQLFPTLKRKIWLGKLLGTFVAILAISSIYLLIECSSSAFGFIYLITVAVSGIVSVIILIMDARMQKAAGEKTHYLSWVFPVMMYWIVFFLVVFAVTFEGF